MRNATHKKCPYCGGKGKIEVVQFLPVEKMSKIMKKHKLTQTRVATLCGISQSGVNNWFKPKTLIRGIKKKYFLILESKGFK